jgi:hypothetical protein
MLSCQQEYAELSAGDAELGWSDCDRKLEKLEGLLGKHPLTSSPSLEARLAALRQKLVSQS